MEKHVEADHLEELHGRTSEEVKYLKALCSLEVGKESDGQNSFT